MSNSGNVGAVTVSPQFVSGPISTVAGVPVTNLYGLRRWRAAVADALNADAPIVCVGDSHTFGQNANGVQPATAVDSGADAALGWPGQLRQRFARQYGDPGEGFQFVSTALNDSRIVTSGGSTFSNFGQALAPMRLNWRMTAVGHTITCPAAPVAGQIMVVLANHAGEAVVPTFTKNGGSATALTAPNGTEVPSVQYIPVIAGDIIAIQGVAGSTTVYGVGFRTAQMTGVPVHRLGVCGDTHGNMLGGTFGGILGTTDGVNIRSQAVQQAAAKAHYAWSGSKGLVILYFGTNEQSKQQGTGLDSGVTPSTFGAGIQLAVNQAVSDGWCCLLIGPPASGSELQGAGAAPTTSYSAAMQQVATSTDHCAFIDLMDLWGGNSTAAKAATASAGLRDSGSSHPQRAGYGDIAHNLYRVLDHAIALGN